MGILGTGSAHYAGSHGQHRRPGVQLSGGIPKCQKCLLEGHWTYQCKNEAAYQSRPTRSQQLRDPRARQRFLDASEVPEDLRSKQEEEPKTAASRERQHRKRQRHSSSSSSSSSSGDGSSTSTSGSDSYSSSSSGSETSSTSSTSTSSSSGTSGSSRSSDLSSSSGSSETEQSTGTRSASGSPQRKKSRDNRDSRRLPLQPTEAAQNDVDAAQYYAREEKNYRSRSRSGDRK